VLSQVKYKNSLMGFLYLTRRMFMKINRSVSALVAAACLALAALGGTGAAQAQNVQWSIGIGGPGVHVGVSGGPPVYMSGYPVYEAQPRVIYVQPSPVYVVPRYYRERGRHHGRDRHDRRGKHDRGGPEGYDYWR
jgi:hypothetical protein